MAEDDQYAHVLRQQQRAISSDARAHSDAELVEKLAAMRVNLDVARLQDLAKRFPSAEEASNSFQAEVDRIPESDEDWLWFGLVCLWERWLPSTPSFEMIDDKMQLGYAAMNAGDSAKACRYWKEVWQAILDVMDRFETRTMSEFEERFGGTYSIFDWSQDYERELFNARLEDEQALPVRIEFCETFGSRFDAGDPLQSHLLAARAESFFYMGYADTADNLFRQCLQGNSEPEWVWISWSRCYRDGDTDRKTTRAIEIL